ncbi:MAG TPA: mechanosensitive ion channel [Roseiflexaceae bacterium]|nr:mechanosensitive ion channel [Roseiflexaceae bacterium]
MFEQLGQLFVSFVPRVIAAALILIVGWIIAALVASFAQRLVNRMRVDQRVGGMLADSGEQRNARVSYWFGRLVFWVIMLFAIAGALQALDLTLLVVPFNELLNDFLAFVPRLIAASIVVAVAWLLATVLRFVTVRSLRAVHFDERLAAEREAQSQAASTGTSTGVEPAPVSAEPAPTSAAPSRPPAELLGSAVYWLVWLLMLPAILGALGVESLLLPVQQLMAEILLFLPNLLAAAAILIVGWFAAGFVRRIVIMATQSLGADRLSERVGLSRVLGQGGLSGLAGWVVYVMILIPIVVAALNALSIPAITAPASAMLAVFLNAIPAIFAAALLIGISFVVGRLVARLSADVLTRVGFNHWMEQLHVWSPPANAPVGGEAAVESVDQPRTPAEIVGWIVLVAIMLVATTAALNLLGLTLVADLVAGFMLLAGRILLGLVIFALGLVLANMAARAIAASNIMQAGLLALVARIAVLTLATAMALRQMGLANEIVNLAFGLGGREPAQKEVERFFQALRQRQIGGAAPTVETPRLESRTRPAEGSHD